MSALRIALLMIAPLFLAGAGPSPKLVPDVSQRDIEIRHSFTGAELLLFGAIIYPDGQVPEHRPDIVVVLKGPYQSITLREKQKVAGIWINAESTRFRSVPSYYAVASSRPIGELVDERTAAIYEFGLDKLQLSPSSLNSADTINRFEQGLVDLRRQTGLFVEAPAAVEITDGVLYRAHIPLPARVLVGNYTAETFLVQDGRVLAAATREIDIHKSGFERFVAMASQRYGFLYGLIVVLIALGLGFAPRLIQKRLQ